MGKVDLVVACYLIEDGRVLLVQHKKLQKWLPVGGHIERNETPEQAASREVAEELLGARIRFLDKSQLRREYPMPFSVHQHSVGDHQHYSFEYRCAPIGRIENFNAQELDGFHWFTERELAHGRLDGIIVPTDARQSAEYVLSLGDSVRGI